MFGAASRFGPGVVESVLRSNELEGSHLVLVDLNIERAELLARYGRQRIKTGGLNYKIEVAKAEDRRKALESADFVITSLTSGGVEMLAHDIMIPAKYGVYYLAADTVGPGAVFKVLRLGPLFQDICADMEKICPNAFLINESNPMSAICTVVTHGTKIRVMGLCGSLGGFAGKVANFLGVETKDVSVLVAGINHFIWTREIRVAGQDGHALLRERIAQGKYDPKYEMRAQLFTAFGMFPLGHVGEHLPATPKTVPEEIKNGNGEIFSAQVARLKDDIWKELAKQTEADNPSLNNAKGFTGEFPAMIMAAMIRNKNELQIVNIPNNGAISNLPFNAVVEVPAMLSSTGVKAMCMGEMPLCVAGLMSAHIAQEQLMAKAVLEKSREIALQAFLADPCTKLTVADSIKLFKEMFEAEKRCLSRYK